MIVEQVWTGNAYRNFNYLIVCPQTGDALAIDPLDYGKCLDAARENGWNITQILNTHEHGDHTGGNKAMVRATGAKVIAHQNAGGRIPNMDRGVGAGDVVKVGKTVELECLDTPGHTMSHICVLSHTDQPALFSGDTLFNAGAGNCHNGGHPHELYETFESQLEKLPDDTLISRIVDPKVYTVPRYDGVHIAARIMRNHKIHHLVVTEEKKIVGILSSFDLLKLVEEHRFTMKNAPAESKRQRKV